MASSDFARHYSRNHFCFLFLRVLRCFTSPRSLHTPYFIQVQVTRHDSCWVSPFGHPRINARLPTPQGISQAPTSFIGSRCQGIHHVPLTTCPQQTTNTHKQTTHPRNKPQNKRMLELPAASCSTNRLREHTKQSIRYETTQHPPNPEPLKGPGSTRVQCSRPLSRSQTTRSQPAPTLPPPRKRRRLRERGV